MSNLSQTKLLYAYEDGDTITPSMGVSIDAGYGVSQYWDPNKQAVINTDFVAHNATLYPLPYSSKRGQYVVPDAGGSWFYNNPKGTALTFDANGACTTTGYEKIFKQKSVTVNGLTLPALILIGNIATASDHTDKYIYYSGTFQNKEFLCQQLIPIQTAVGDSYDILMSATGADGSGDEVLSNDNDYVIYTPVFQLAGNSILSGVTYKWQHFSDGSWVDVISQASLYVTGVIAGLPSTSANSLTVYNAGVEGSELYRCVATYQGKTFYKVVNPTDIHDPYYIDDGCSIVGSSVKSDETPTFSPVVYDRSSHTAQVGWNFSYSKVAMNTGDVIGDSVTSKSFSVPYAEIEQYKGIRVRIQATKA